MQKTIPAVVSALAAVFTLAANPAAAQQKLDFILNWVPGGDHAHSARDSAVGTLAWIADRFAARPAPSDCKTI